MRSLSADIVEVGLDLDPTFQGLGHAKPVYAQLAANLLLRGIDTICLRVLNSNGRARRLYLDMGFREVPLLQGEEDVFMYAKPDTLVAAYARRIHPMARDSR